MDTNQNDDQQMPGVVQPTDPQQGVAQQSDDQQAPISQTPGPTTTPHGKEAAPVPVQQGEVQEYVQPAAHETAPILPEEVEKAGVGTTPDQQAVELSPDQKAAGIETAGSAVPLSVNSRGTFLSPMTFQQAEEAAKGKADDSGTWLGQLVVFLFGKEREKKVTP